VGDSKIKINFQKKLKEFQHVLIVIVGISFWFFLGFPFANHNESYIWVVQLRQLGFFDVLSKNLRPIANFRPLGTITAWLGYRLSGGSIFPQQIFNYILAVLAWIILYLAIREKKLFSWVSLIVSGAFFSGYLYLFHLHGVFYSPLLFFLSFLLVVSISSCNRMRDMKMGLILCIAFFISLYHPFAIMFYIAFLLGHFFENIQIATRKQLALNSLFLVIAFGLMKILVFNNRFSLTTDKMLGLLISYKLVEINSILSIISWVLVIITVLSLEIPLQTKVSIGSIITILSLVFIRLNLPILILWVFVCLMKATLMKKWRIVLLIIVTALLPIATATGSPTYTIFVLMTCSTVVPLGWSILEKDFIFYNNMVITFLISICLILVLLKNDVDIPIISRLVRPILAEKEKTFQMEEIIKWLIGSNYAEYRLVLRQPAESPIRSADAIERTHRAPTSQNYLDIYCSSQIPKYGIAGELIVCFGEEKIDGAKRIYTVAGKYNGEAIVYRACAN